MLVSVIIPTYNRCATIVAAVESVLAQSYRDIEVIIVDDGSTDSTTDILADYSDRISIIRQENSGPSAARNRGVLESSGGIIAFLDSDDSWMPDKIARQVDLMESVGESMCCCVCNAAVIGISGEDAGNTFDVAGLKMDCERGELMNPPEVLATRFILFNQVVAIRRDAFVEVGGFNRSLRLLEDYELALKLATVGKWGLIREPMVMKRNDTMGIGVECMSDHAKHVSTCADVIAGFLASKYRPSGRALNCLNLALADLKTEAQGLSLSSMSEALPRLAGGFLKTWVKVRRAVRRRSPLWPRPVIRNLS
ncbi:MAG: glycosyltransferase family A protein [Luteolibacter sp.]